MTDDPHGEGTPEAGQTIVPVTFRSASQARRKTVRTAVKWAVAGCGCLLAAAVLAVAGVAITAQRVTVTIDPEPASMDLKGGLPVLRFGGRYLMRPGDYTLTAETPCFAPLWRQLTIERKENQVFHFTMEKVPGKLAIGVHPEGGPQQAIDGARITIDGAPRGVTPMDPLDIPPGRRRLSIQADRYQDYQGDVTVDGCGKLQTLDFELKPGWSDVFVSSVPPGAAIRVDGKPTGTTPASLELMAGAHDLQMTAAGYEPWETRLDLTAGQGREIKDVALKPVAAKAVPPAPKEGIVRFSVAPQGADLVVDGTPMGKVPDELRLTAAPHKIDIRKKGYRTHRVSVTPRPGKPRTLKVFLEPVAVVQTASAGPVRPAEPPSSPGPVTAPKPVAAPGTAAATVAITAPNGYPLNPIPTGTFTMGASRREQGRRSNETLRNIQFSRPFYMGAREVTNGEFRAFSGQHNAGAVRTYRLDGNGLPVVQITWEQAALYCNWLSEQAGLPPAYVKQGDIWTAAKPMTTGFRLPTEAEWEYCARYNGSRSTRKYPWGDGFPPPKNAGNFADVSAKDLLPGIIEGYNDGYPVTAPPGKFVAGAFGLLDMGGNVAEWCHDRYTIYSYSPKVVTPDPMGAGTGKLHSIKGSSWKTAGIGPLRAAYRDYGDEKRDDVGFRICRYLK